MARRTVLLRVRVKRARPTKAVEVQVHDRKEETSQEITLQIADKMGLGTVMKHHSLDVFRAISVAARIAKQAMFRIVEILRAMGSYSLEAIQRMLPDNLGGISSFVTSLASSTTGTFKTVGEAVKSALEYANSSWITKILGALFVFRYVYNSCTGISDDQLESLQKQALATITGTISMVAPFGASHLLNGCVAGAVRALSSSIGVIQIALGPVVSLCTVALHRVTAIDERQQRLYNAKAAVEEKELENKMRGADAASAQIAATYAQQAQLSEQRLLREKNEELREQQRHQQQQVRNAMQTAVERKAARIRFRELNRRNEEISMEERNREKEIAFKNKRVGPLSYFNIPGLSKMVRGVDLFGWTDAEHQEYMMAMRRTAEKNGTKPQSPTAKRTAPKRSSVRIGALLSPGHSWERTAWRQTPQLQRLARATGIA